MYLKLTYILTHVICHVIYLVSGWLFQRDCCLKLNLVNEFKGDKHAIDVNVDLVQDFTALMCSYKLFSNEMMADYETRNVLF